MKNLTLLLLVAILATINTKATFQLFSHSGSWCDYETKLGKVNIQVKQKGLSSSAKHLFNMTLLDSHGGEFEAMCTIEAFHEELEKENEEEEQKEEDGNLENEDEKESIDEEENIKEETQEKEDQTEELEDQLDEKEDKAEDEQKGEKEDEKEDKAEDEKEDEKEDKAEDEQKGEKEDKAEDEQKGEKEDEKEDRDKDKQKDEQKDEQKEEEEEVPNNNGRILEEEDEVFYPHSYCLFTPIKHDGHLTYKKDSITTKEDIQIEVEDDFHVIAQKCLSEGDEAKKISLITLSFRQINFFKYENGEISFKFFGITTQGFTKIEIHLFVYLFFNGKLESELKEAICTLNQEVKLTNNRPVQVTLECKITNLKKEYTSFKIGHSEEIAGIPYYDDVLLDPKKTEEAIKAGDLLDFSKEENQVVPPTFTPSSIDGSKCSTNGKFTYTGKFDSEFEGAKALKFHLLFPAGEISCNFPSAQANKEVNIECIFIGKEIEQSFINGQLSIKQKRKEVLIMKGFSSPNKIKCIDGEVSAAQNKKKLSLSFRQINHFKFANKQITFDFFGLTSKPLEKNFEIIFYVFLISGGVKETSLKEVKCVLAEGVTLPSGKKLIQAQFTCTITGLEKEYSSLEISNSDDIAGIPDDDVLLDPVKTEEAIKKKELTDFSENPDVPSSFTSGSVDGSKCSEKGELSISGQFDKVLTSEVKFEIIATYPSDTRMKCTVSPGESVINCVSSEINGASLILEQQIIKDGLKELFILGSLESSKELYCENGDENLTSDTLTSDTLTSDISSDETTEGSFSDLTSDEVSDQISSNSTEDEISLDEALQRAKISISFRQLNKFSFVSGTITFMFFGFSTQSYPAGTEIKMLVNLITSGGETEEVTKEVVCSLVSDISTSEGQSAQGDFKCTLSGLEGEYYSLRLNSSEDIAGIPDDKILLNPLLTTEAIERGDLLDYSLDENKGEDKIPSTLTLEAVKEQNCKEDGKLTIEGKLSKDVKNELKFDLPLTYPDGISLSCSLTSLKAGDSSIECQVDRALESEQIVIEQKTIKDGAEEVLTIGSIASEENITCSDGLLQEAENRTNIDVAFRQVSQFKENRKNGFSFFFAGLLTKECKAGFELKIKIVVVLIIGGKKEKKEKEATCKLKSDVSPSDGTQVQGDFDCEATVESDEYNNINFTDSQSVSVSTNNPEVSGVSEQEDTKLSPISTDQEIDETKEAQEANDTLTDLAETLDYSEEENKKILPPTFQPETLTNYLSSRGKFKIKGKFTSDVTEKMVFYLPLSYPSSKVKCKVDEAKANEDVEVFCKVEKKFKKVKFLVIENRLLKTKSKEVVFINKKSIKLNEECQFENYYHYKLEKSKKRRKAGFSFLSLGNFAPSRNVAKFNMGIMKKTTVTFTTIKISIIITKSVSSNLRQLQQNKGYISANCAVSEENGNIANLDCASDTLSGTPQGLLLDNDDIEEISGVPDDADPSKPTYNLDFKDTNLLKSLNNLPTVSIDKIDGSTCYKNGDYTIEGTYKGGSLKDTPNVEIPFGNPDSSGLCQLKVVGNKVTMDCHNKEKFDASTIMFEQNIIKDSEGNYLFNLNSYTNKEQFACDISVNSVLPKVEPNNSNPDPGSNPTTTPNNPGETTKRYNKNNYKGSSSGLSGGAIAAIIICSIVALAIVGAFIGLGLKGKTATAPIDTTVGTNSSLSNFAYNPKKNEV